MIQIYPLLSLEIMSEFEVVLLNRIALMGEMNNLISCSPG